MTIFILVLENAFASGVAQSVDLLTAAAALAKIQGNPAPPVWRVCGVASGPVRLSNGMTIMVSPLPKRCTAQDICIVPGLGIDNPELALERIEQGDAKKMQGWLLRAFRSKATIYAACSAVLLLAPTGMLVGKKATTAWWLARTLEQLEPQAHVDVARMVIDEGSIVTAGAALAQADLILCLIKRHFSLALADAVSRFVLASQRTSQAAYMLPTAHTSGDEFVRRVSRRLQSSLPDAPSMKVLAAELNMTERTLARRVVATTGKTPLSLLQGIRIHHAQALLENTRLSVDEIAARVGYSDATALRRLLKRATNATPSQLRHI
jgi:transcriptional regulator GlxA family with amidase domain